MAEDASNAIRQADAFHKNIALLFEDLYAGVQEKGLATKIRPITNEGMYGVWSSKDSEHKRLFIFEGLGKLRFIHLLAKVYDAKLRGKGTKYKAVCARLEVDPLIVCCGTFEPRNLVRFAQDNNLRRNWADNTVLLEVPDEIDLANPDSYTVGRTVSLESKEGTDSWHCEKATVNIRRLMEI